LNSPDAPGHIAPVTIYDPRHPDTLLWISAMEPAEAASVMLAMKQTFPILRGNKVWAKELEARCAGMSDRERQAIAKRAGRIGKRILAETAKDLGHKPYLR
jgi:hypothetical protein